MTTYAFPTLRTVAPVQPTTVWTVASGDLRLSANTRCWPTQQQLEAALGGAVERLGWQVHRGHEVDPVTGHGFIDSSAAASRYSRRSRRTRR